MNIKTERGMGGLNVDILLADDGTHLAHLEYEGDHANATKRNTHQILRKAGALWEAGSGPLEYGAAMEYIEQAMNEIKPNLPVKFL